MGDHRLNSITIDGTTYPLGHLRSFLHTFTGVDSKDGTQRSFQVQVVFTDHCYSREPAADEEPYEDEIVIENDREFRVFDRKRYSMSFALPQAIKNLMGNRCFFGDRNNYFFIRLENGEQFHVFFQVSRTGRNRLLMRVQSAHQTRQKTDLQSVQFGGILKGTLEGHPPRPKR